VQKLTTSCGAPSSDKSWQTTGEATFMTRLRKLHTPCMIETTEQWLTLVLTRTKYLEHLFEIYSPILTSSRVDWFKSSNKNKKTSF